jgi:glycosyltransferase involved in cell wall biosynthesis
MHIVIDARILAGTMTGTQLHVLELIAGLSRTGRARITALVPPNISEHAAAMLASLERVQPVTDRRDGTRAPIARADLVHRPFQVNSPADLWSAAQLADRLVVTQQDMIAYHNPAYFHSSHAWEGYRELTRNALAAADRVLFFSDHARADALAEDLIEPGRAAVVHIGTDHSFHRDAVVPARPPAAAPLADDAEVILCIGTDFRHKNRMFALRILEQLRERHAWPGFLVFAGPAVAAGSSAPDETRMLASRPQLATSVLDVGAVSEEEKAWLMRRASLALYPTVHEGFGLVPFEAADNGVPCLWARGTSLSEVLPDAVGGIVPWDPVASAENAIELIRSESAREANLTAIRAAAIRFTWDATAAHLLEVYRETCDGPASPAGGLERRNGQMQGALSEDAMRLVGPDGALPGELERPLLALATHPQIGKPVFGAVRLGYRASVAFRRRRRPEG